MTHATKVCLVTAATIVAYLCLPVLRTRITEFSPTDMQFRTRTACYLGIITFTEERWETELLTLVKATHWVNEGKPHDHRWHFVDGDRIGVKGWHGAAKAALRLFRDTEWLEWTRENPVASKGIWKEVLDLLNAGDFDGVGELRILKRPERRKAAGAEK